MEQQSTVGKEDQCLRGPQEGAQPLVPRCQASGISCCTQLGVLQECVPPQILGATEAGTMGHTHLCRIHRTCLLSVWSLVDFWEWRPSNCWGLLIAPSDVGPAPQRGRLRNLWYQCPSYGVNDFWECSGSGGIWGGLWFKSSPRKPVGLWVLLFPTDNFDSVAIRELCLKVQSPLHFFWPWPQFYCFLF